MRIDVSAFVGAYPFRRVPGTSPEGVLAAMDRTGIDEAWVTHLPGIFWRNPHDGNRWLLDICRALPDGSELTITLEGERLLLRAKRSRFTLSTLPAGEFPTVDEINPQQTLKVAEKDFKHLLDKTHFSMAQQDVR